MSAILALVVAALDMATAGQLYDAIRHHEGRLRARGERPTAGLVKIREVVEGIRQSLAVESRTSPAGGAQGVDDEAPVLLTLHEVADRLRIGLTTVKGLCAAKDGAPAPLRSVRIGRARRVHSDDLESFMNNLEEA